MQEQTIKHFGMVPGGKTLRLDINPFDEDFAEYRVVSADLVAAAAGVNIGSVIKVFIALALVSSVTDTNLESLARLGDVPLTPPDPERQRTVFEALSRIAREVNDSEALLSEELRLDQRLLKMRR